MNELRSSMKLGIPLGVLWAITLISFALNSTTSILVFGLSCFATGVVASFHVCMDVYNKQLPRRKLIRKCIK